jgi:hypothetical protein
MYRRGQFRPDPALVLRERGRIGWLWRNNHTGMKSRG